MAELAVNYLCNVSDVRKNHRRQDNNSRHGFILVVCRWIRICACTLIPIARTQAALDRAQQWPGWRISGLSRTGTAVLGLSCGFHRHGSALEFHCLRHFPSWSIRGHRRTVWVPQYDANSSARIRGVLPQAGAWRGDDAQQQGWQERCLFPFLDLGLCAAATKPADLSFKWRELRPPSGPMTFCRTAKGLPSLFGKPCSAGASALTSLNWRC